MPLCSVCRNDAETSTDFIYENPLLEPEETCDRCGMDRESEVNYH